MKLSIDLGGTNIRIAQIEGGKCVSKRSVPCRAQEASDVVVKQLTDLIGEMMCEDVEGIGIGVPSIVDTQKGIVYNVANIASWKEVHLKDIIEKQFNVPVEVNNDCNCFALGEGLYGAGKGYSDIIGTTLGTGIGAGIIINGKLYSGMFAGAGEIGSLPYLDSDFEHYCSSFFFKEKYNTSGAELAERASKGEKEAIAIWNEFGTHLGNFINAVLYTYAPQAIIIGGGIASAFDLFADAMHKVMDTFPYPSIAQSVKVLPASSSDANLLGAAALLD